LSSAKALPGISGDIRLTREKPNVNQIIKPHRYLTGQPALLHCNSVPTVGVGPSPLKNIFGRYGRIVFFDPGRLAKAAPVF
jgi:hypothetical protein